MHNLEKTWPFARDVLEEYLQLATCYKQLGFTETAYANTIKNRCYLLTVKETPLITFGLLQQESGEIELSRRFCSVLISNS